MITCAECSSYPCDNSGSRLKTDKACDDFFKPFEFHKPIEDSNGGAVGIIHFAKYGDEIHCTIQYPLKGGGFLVTDPITFRKLATDVKDEIHKKVCEHCNPISSKWVMQDLEAIYKELQGLHWYPKTWKATAKPKEATEQTQEGQIQADESDIQEETRKAAYNEAMEILKNGDPVRYLQYTIGNIHIGDTDAVEGLILAIANQSCTNTQGLQIKMSGASGSGKSHIVDSVLQCVRTKHKHESTLSAKAAYYLNMKSGTILYSDDAIVSEDMEEVIKRATSKYQKYTTHTTVKDQTPKILTIAPRILWLLTSVDDEVSDQLLNRQLVFSIDESTEQKKAIFEMQRKEAIEGILHTQCVTHEVLVCREIIDHIKKSLFSVKIPFGNGFKLADLSNTRNFPMFLDAIKGYTIFMQEQREKDEDGYLLATIDDYVKAKRLIESQSESLRTKLNDKERKILAAIRQGDPWIDVNELASKTGYTYYQIRDAVEGRDRKSGLLIKVPGLKKEEQIVRESDEYPAKNRRQTVYSYSGKGNALALYDSAFIELEE